MLQEQLRKFSTPILTALTIGALALGAMLQTSAESTPEPATATSPAPITPTDPLIPTITPTTPYEACSWQWAQQEIPELSAQLIEGLQQAELTVESARASAYGENCINSAGDVVRFAAMQTDFYIVLQVENLENADILGNLLRRVCEQVLTFPIDETPGPNAGYIRLTFSTGQDELNLWFGQLKAENLLKQGLNDANLLQAIQSQP